MLSIVFDVKRIRCLLPGEAATKFRIFPRKNTIISYFSTHVEKFSLTLSLNFGMSFFLVFHRHLVWNDDPLSSESEKLFDLTFMGRRLGTLAYYTGAFQKEVKFLTSRNFFFMWSSRVGSSCET